MLSERIRAGSEAALWVVDEVQQMETRIAELEAEKADIKTTRDRAITESMHADTRIIDLEAKVTELEAELAQWKASEQGAMHAFVRGGKKLNKIAEERDQLQAKVMELESKCILLDSEMANRCYECEVHKNEE